MSRHGLFRVDGEEEHVVRKDGIIDAHAHIYPEREWNVRQLLRSMDRARIERSVVFASARGDRMPTEQLLEKIAPHRDRLVGIASFSITDADPGNKKRFTPTLERLGEALESGDVRGLKFYTGYEHFYPDDERLRPYLDLLELHARPAIFHGGDCGCRIKGARLKYAHPLRIDDLASDRPELRIIIAHLANPWITDAAIVCYKNKHVYSDCSGFVDDGFTPSKIREFHRVWRRFNEITDVDEPGGRSKILFGTDWPLCDQNQYVAAVETVVGRHRERVFHGNAKKLFGL